MKINDSYELVGTRTKWQGIVFLFAFICFGVYSYWLLYSLNSTNNPDSLLVVMTILVLIFGIVFLVCSVLVFTKKKKALYISWKKLIVFNYHEKDIEFSNIASIKYRENTTRYKFVSTGRCSGTIYITLKDNKVIKAKDIKDVKNVCMILNEKIFIKKIDEEE